MCPRIHGFVCVWSVCSVSLLFVSPSRHHKLVNRIVERRLKLGQLAERLKSFDGEEGWGGGVARSFSYRSFKLWSDRLDWLIYKPVEIK